MLVALSCATRICPCCWGRRRRRLLRDGADDEHDAVRLAPSTALDACRQAALSRALESAHHESRGPACWPVTPRSDGWAKQVAWQLLSSLAVKGPDVHAGLDRKAVDLDTWDGPGASIASSLGVDCLISSGASPTGHRACPDILRGLADGAPSMSRHTPGPARRGTEHVPTYSGGSSTGHPSVSGMLLSERKGVRSRLAGRCYAAFEKNWRTLEQVLGSDPRERAASTAPARTG
jgi:hypothetical protein